MPHLEINSLAQDNLTQDPPSAEKTQAYKQKRKRGRRELKNFLKKQRNWVQWVSHQKR